MQRINWIILHGKDRGTNYGVGTFITHFSDGLSRHERIRVFVLQTELKEVNKFHIEMKGNITYLKFPKLMKDDAQPIQEEYMKAAKGIARVMSQYISNSAINLVHMNFRYEYLLGEALKKVLNAKIIYTQHITPFSSEPVDGNIIMDEKIFMLSDAIVPVSNNGKDSLISRLANRDKLVTIYNGISHKLFEAEKKPHYIRKKYGLGKDAKLILYSGRLDFGKGLQYLLEAFFIVLKRQKDCHLIVAGDGEFSELVKFAAPMSSHIRFLGRVPFNELLDLYKEAIIGVIPSLKEECSYVALEMLHCGLPVIASNIGGLKEIFTHGEDAFLLEMTKPTGNKIYPKAPEVTQISDYIIQLLEDESLRERFAAAAQKKAMEKFTDETMINGYLELMQTQLKL